MLHFLTDYSNLVCLRYKRH